MLNVAKRLKVRQDYQVSTEFSNSPGDLGKLRISRMVRMESRPQGLEWGVTDDKVGDPPSGNTLLPHSQVGKSSLHKAKQLAQCHSRHKASG